MKKIYLFLVIFQALLFGAERNLDSLLSEYREAEELYIDTKESMNGHITLFSRADLDKMQAYTLNDVLKTIRMFTLKSTKFGMNAIVKAPYSENSMSSVKIFIDSYELTSLTSATGLSQLGKMGLNFIDHIEVYQASNAVAFMGEPGNMVIKLYTKDPARENSAVLQASGDSRGGTRAQIIDAGAYGEYQYLANLDISSYSPRKYDVPGNEHKLSKDGRRGQLYLNLQKKGDFILELGAALSEDDMFYGFGPSIQDGEIFTTTAYVQFTKYFDNDIMAILSTTYENLDISNSDSTGFLLQNLSTCKDLDITVGSTTHSAIVQKRFTYKDNDIRFGAQIKLKSIDLKEFKNNGLDDNLILGPKDINIYMFFFEDAYSVTKNTAITVGAKYDRYDNRIDTSANTVLRLGHITLLDDTTSLRSFIQKGYVYPVFSQMTFSPLYLPNPELKAAKTLVAKIELEKKIGDLTMTLGAGGSKSKDGIVFNPSANMYVNNSDNSDFGMYTLNLGYRFDADNKIIAEFFKAYKQNKEFSSDSGALLQIYNTIGRFDIYNELIYRSAYVGLDGTKIDSGLDYTFGAIYRYDKNLDIKIKGENLLGRASQTGINGLKVNPYDRRAILTVEYMF